MSGIFNEFLTQLNIPLPERKRVKTEAEFFVEGEYIKRTEHYRVLINKAKSLNEKYTLALELISELTGDKLFFEQNIKQLNNDRKE